MPTLTDATPFLMSTRSTTSTAGAPRVSKETRAAVFCHNGDPGRSVALDVSPFQFPTLKVREQPLCLAHIATLSAFQFLNSASFAPLALFLAMIESYRRLSDTIHCTQALIQQVGFLFVTATPTRRNAVQAHTQQHTHLCSPIALASHTGPPATGWI